MTLAGAKDAARAAREQIRQGVDPVQQRSAARSALAAQGAASITFKEAAERYIAANEAGWKNSKHAAQWGTTLEKYVYPSVGKIQVAAVETSHVVSILEPIWTNSPRLQAVCEVVSRRSSTGQPPVGTSMGRTPLDGKGT